MRAKFFLFTMALFSLTLMFAFFCCLALGAGNPNALEDLTRQTGGSFTVIGEASAEEKTPPPAVNNKVDFETWIDYAAKGFDGGTGTEKNPYRIATAEQLAYLAKTVNEGNTYEGKYFKLTKDIDLGKHEWMPIGTVRHLKRILDQIRDNLTFSGTFDGNDKCVSNLNVGFFASESGLFGTLYRANVQSLKMKGVNIAIGFDVGCLAARSIGAKIINCSVNGQIKGAANVGGVVGYSWASDIVGCSVHIKINKSLDKSFWENVYQENTGDDYFRDFFPYAGGVVGYALDFGEIKTLIQKNNVCIISDGFYFCGSIVGNEKEHGAIVEDCIIKSVINGISINN